jgi:hypothetical protein
MKRPVQLLAALAGFAVPALMTLAPPPGAATGAEAPPLVQSPPVFALRGAPVAIEATPSGAPSAMTLVAGSMRTNLRREPSGVWSGVISPSAAPVVRYRVDATYGDGRVATGDVETLSYLDRIDAVPAEAVAANGTHLLTIHLGPDVGVTEGTQAARLLPASFAVDEAASRIDVLDSPNARIASFDFTGRPTGTIPIATGSTTVDDLVRTPGTSYVLDALRRQLVRISSEGQVVSNRVVPSGEPANLRLAVSGDGLFVRDPAQGRLLPLLGTPPAVRDASVVLDGGAILVGDLCEWRVCSGGEGARIVLDRALLDVADYGVDGRGVLWVLADVDDGTMRLVSLDLAHPSVATVRTVDAGVFGDVTRRLVTLGGGGAVVMSGDATTLTFTRYAVAR